MSLVGFDTFSEASANVALGSHIPDTGGGAGWATEVAQFNVLFATDKVQHNRNALDRARKGDNIGDDDMDVTAVLSVGSAARIAGVCGRMSTDGYANQYEALLTFNTTTLQDVRLFKNISGTRTGIGLAVTIALGANVECTLKLEIRSGTQRIYVDSVLVVDRAEPDSTLAGRTYAGIIMNGNNTANASISSFQSESVSGSPDIEATVSGVGDLVAALTTDITMAAALAGQGDLIADLSTPTAGLSASLTGTGDLIADLTTGGAGAVLAAAVAGVGDVVAALTTDITMAAALAGSGDLVAALTTDLSLAASVSGTGTLVADLAAATSVFLAAMLRGTGELQAALVGGHATLRFATYDIYIAGQLVELGVVDDTAVTVSLSDTYTGTTKFGGVTIRLGLGRGPEVAALFNEATRGAGLRIYHYDAITTLQTLVFDGVINTLQLDTTALVVEGIQVPIKVLETKIPVALVDTTWPQAFGKGRGEAVDIDVPLPDVVGSVPRSRCVYVNRDRTKNIYDYIICKMRGAIGVPAMYRSVSSSGGHDKVALITASEYTISLGRRYPGYISAKFPVEQIDTGGGEHTIYADIVTNPDMNITRNPVRVLRMYLEELGQTVVTASFDAAEAEYTRLGYGLDFSLTEQVQLQELTRDIGLMLDSVLDRTSKGWTFETDIRPTTVDYQFSEGTADLTPTIVEIGPLSLPPVQNETSQVIVKYLPDSLEKSKYLGTVTRTLSTSVHASPLELTFPWIRSWNVADHIADYKAKQIRTRNRTVSITGPRAAAVPIRTLVRVTSPRRRLTNAIFLVKSLQQSILGQPQLECVAWAPDPYVYEAGPPPIDPVLGTFLDFSRIPPPIITDITFPTGAPYEGVEIGPAGAMKAFVTLRFVTPSGGNYAFAVARYRATTTTIWVPVGGPITQLGTVDIKIRNLEPQVSYDFSVQSFNQWGLTAGGE